MSSPSAIDGFVAAGFEPVRNAFAGNFHQRGELGSGCAVVLGGELVVDLWGGLRSERTREPWQRDTLALIFSTTKGIAAACLAVAHARGWIHLDRRIADYWPEFAQSGKEDITVRQLLMHQAGLPVIRERLHAALLADLDSLANVLARARPAWPPGEHHGYHAVSLGFFLNELMRRVTPQKAAIGQFLREQINPSLGTDLHIGLPRELPADRLAVLKDFHPLHAALHARSFPTLAVLAMAWPWSKTYRALMNPHLRRPGDLGRPPLCHVEMPSANGFATARDLAILFGDLALGGPRLGLSEGVFKELTHRPPAPPGGRRDRVVHTSLVYSSFGYFMPAPGIRFGSSRSAFGSPGAGGSFAFADPDVGLGYAYTTSQMGYHLFDDPREKALRDAVMRCAR